MSDDFMNAIELTEFECLPADAISLSPAHIDHALELSQRSPQTENRWQIYLTALALAGVEQWLHDRTPDLSVQQTHCTLLSSPFTDATTAACNLQVNGFKLCILGTESVFDDAIAIPAAAIDSSDCVAHFYVPVEVYEEQAHIRLWGFYAMTSYNNVSPSWNALKQTPIAYRWIGLSVISIGCYCS